MGMLIAMDIALRALSAQQQAINVLNHNIANANTPGYSRQQVSMMASPPYLVPTFSGATERKLAGNGVEIRDVTRVREAFIDLQIYNERRELGAATVKRETFDKLQIVYNEPSDTGLNNLLSRFWESWQDLSSVPGDASARAAVIQQGVSVATILNRNYGQLEGIRRDLFTQAGLKAAEVNSIAAKLAQLNGQIQRAQLGGQKANDLLDQRDAMLESLSALVKFHFVVQQDDTVAVFVGDQILVDRTAARSIRADVDTAFQLTYSYADTSQAFSPGGGALQGIQDSNNSVMSTKMTELNVLANQLRGEVNALHSSGFDANGNGGVPFFIGTGAGDLVVNGALQSNAALVAASGRPGAAGDGTVALAIAQLQHIGTKVAAGSNVTQGLALTTSGVSVRRLTVPGAASGVTYSFDSPAPGQLRLTGVVNGITLTQTLAVSDMTGAGNQVLDFSSLGIRIALHGTGPSATATNIIADLTAPGSDSLTVAARTTVDQAYQKQIATLGVEARTAIANESNETVLLASLTRRRDSISGVSLDEEAASLIKYQRAYQAAARLITVVDEMMETLIRGLGVTGR